MKAAGTVSVLTARPAIEALERRGIDAEPPLEAAHLSREVLASNDTRLPNENVQRLWNEAAAAARDDAFGVHVAEELPLGSFELIEYLFCASPTMGAGLSRLVHYMHLIDTHSVWRLVVEPLHASLIRHVARPAAQYDEFSLTLLLVHSRQWSGVQWTPEKLIVQHQRSAGEGELARVFGCPIVFGAARTEIRFPPSVLQLPLTRADSRLIAILARYADSLTAVPASSDLVTSVSSIIAREMAKELPSLRSTAEAVRLPERTLQRRLAEKGFNHSMLVDQVRRDLALKYIGDAGLSIGEIAYLLHFSDSTALHRAFKRWTGAAPAQYRQRLFGHSRQA